MSGGHEAVKTTMAAHLADRVPSYMPGVQVASWPPAPTYIAVTDMLPEADRAWPCVLVSATAMVQPEYASAIGDNVFVGVYDVRLTVGVRATKERDVESAIYGRDRLMLAIRRLLLQEPDLDGDGVTIALTRDLREETDPAANDPKTRPVAMGAVRLQVRHIEDVPDLAAVEVDQASVDIEISDAADTDSTTITVPPTP